MDEGRAKDCLSSHMLRTVTNGELSFVQMSYAVSSSFSAGISTVCFISFSLSFSYMNGAAKELFIGDCRIGRFTAYVQLLAVTTRSDTR